MSDYIDEFLLRNTLRNSKPMCSCLGEGKRGCIGEGIYTCKKYFREHIGDPEHHLSGEYADFLDRDPTK